MSTFTSDVRKWGVVTPAYESGPSRLYCIAHDGYGSHIARLQVTRIHSSRLLLCYICAALHVRKCELDILFHVLLPTAAAATLVWPIPAYMYSLRGLDFHENVFGEFVGHVGHGYWLHFLRPFVPIVPDSQVLGEKLKVRSVRERKEGEVGSTTVRSNEGGTAELRLQISNLFPFHRISSPV